MEHATEAPGTSTKRGRLCLITASASVEDALCRQWTPAHAVAAVPPGGVLQLPQRQRMRLVNRADVLLVDWSPETMPAFLVLQPVAFVRGVPVFAICRGTDADRVTALVMGADDAIGWPVKPIMLEARLLAYRRVRSARHVPGGGRVAGSDDGPITPARNDQRDEAPDGPDPEGASPAPPKAEIHGAVLDVGRLTLDAAAHHFYVDGAHIVLTPMEYELVHLLMSRAGSCVTREEIIDRVWGVDFDMGSNLLDVRIYGLRRKLKPFGLQHAVATVRGTGYRLDL